MDTETRLSGFGLSLLGGFVAIAIAFTGSASITDRSGTTKIAPVDPQAIARIAASDPAAQVGASNSVVRDAPRNTAPSGDALRTKLHCAGCGVVESVRQVERREIAAGVCYAPDSERFWMRGNARDGTAFGGTASSIAAGVFTGQPDARTRPVKSIYQIVVRFRNGSRHVFDEATPRTLQPGERVQVIAGADLASNGRSWELPPGPASSM